MSRITDRARQLRESYLQYRADRDSDRTDRIRLAADARPHLRRASRRPGRNGRRTPIRERIDAGRLAVVKAGKSASAAVHRVAEQGLQRARLTGAKLARHIIAVQKAAGATPKMMRESARSVAARPMTRDGDRAWQAAYVREAERHVRGLAPHREPAMTPPAPSAPARPAWPHTAGPIDPAHFRSDLDHTQPSVSHISPAFPGDERDDREARLITRRRAVPPRCRPVMPPVLWQS